MNEISYKIGLWYDKNRRELPWRHTRDAYCIWLSEVILQQTRVVQGLDYYQRFVSAYPTVKALADAQEDEVLKLWQGLGYYSRARNLLAAARQVVALQASASEPKAEDWFPTQFDELLRLKGVGRYTAAAVASFAADEAVAVVDGNVYRVLSRLFDIDTPIDTTAGQKQFQELADVLLAETVADGRQPSSHHNQALMEFGALHCTPTSPRCAECPVADHCLALANGTMGERPVKQGKVKVRERHLAYIIYIYKDTVWVHRRKAGDIWQGLWEFVLNERANGEAVSGSDNKTEINDEGMLILTKKHQLTHQTLYAEFRVVRLDDALSDPRQHPAIQALPDDYQQVTWAEWQQLAVPRLIDEANAVLSAWF